MKSNSPMLTGNSRVLGKDPASRALAKISDAHSLYEKIKPSRDRFARALSLDWTNGYNDTLGATAAADPENFGIHAVNYSFRYMQILKAYASALPPKITYPRDAGAGQAPESMQNDPAAEQVPGDEDLAMWAETLINRAVGESGATDAWAEAIDDIGAMGCGIVMIGYHREVVHPEHADNASRSVSEIADQTRAGDLQAKPAELHKAASDHLRALTRRSVDPEDVEIVMTDDERQAFHARAQSHDAMALEESKKNIAPAWGGYSIWARRLQAGIDVFWDSTVTRIEDAQWMARRIEMTYEEFKASPLFTAAAKKNITGTGKRGETGFNGARDYNRIEQPTVEEEIVVLYEFWERHVTMASGGVRHFVSNEWPGHYLERSDRNPYLDPRDGSMQVPGFYPFYVSTPMLPPVNDPVRTFGIPGIAPGWPQQIEANELRTLSIASAKRHSLRVYIMSDKLAKQRAAKARLMKGQDGTVFTAPPGVTTAAEMKAQLVPVDFSSNNREIERQEAFNEAAWRKVMGISSAIFLGEGASATLGQDEIAANASRDQQGYIIGNVEEAFARMCEGIRGLLKRYPREKVGAMLGAEGAKHIALWSASSLDGDRLTAEFGARAAARDRVDKKQRMEIIALFEQKQEAGMPVFNTIPYYDEAARDAGLGAPRLMDPKRVKVNQMAQAFQLLNEAAPELVSEILQTGKAPGQPSGGDGKAPTKPSPSAPSNQNIGAGARRGAGSANR